MTSPQKPEPADIAIPTSYARAAAQVRQAQDEMTQDYGDIPALPWANVAALVGRPLPRDLWVVGARTKNGKTSFLLNVFDALVGCRWPTLYIGAGAEGPPKDIRRQWAALRCGYPVDRILENDWAGLPPDAKDRVFAELQAQATARHETAHFFEGGEKVTPKVLAEAMAYARRNRCRAVIFDHVNRLRFDAATDERRGLSEATRWLRDMAGKYDLTVLVAAQLHRANADKGPLRDLVPPAMSDLKGTGTLEEDCVVGLLLHRTRRAGLAAKDVAAVMKNERPVADIVEPATMCVRVGVHRRRGHVNDCAAFLRITRAGRLEARESPYGDGAQLALDAGAREREPGEGADDLPF